MLYKQKLGLVACLALGAAAAPAAAQDPLVVIPGASSPDSGFYGGVVLRQGTQDKPGLQIGNFLSAWGKFVSPTADEAGSRTLMFGGYRWANDIAVEAAFATVDRYALAPSGRGGVGLALASSSDTIASRGWNADVYTTWSFRKSLALYGRLGYAQSESPLV